MKGQSWQLSAAEMELSVARFKHELREHIHDVRIQQDRENGWKSGTHEEVPTLFINDVRYQGELKLAFIVDAVKNR